LSGTGADRRDSRALPAQRRAWVASTVRERGAVSVGEIVDRFGVSAATARRDINVIGRTEGLRVHGGLVRTWAVRTAPPEGR
jgi:DeoR/GlpR family transcriptional regulator of sugar metabolism